MDGLEQELRTLIVESCDMDASRVAELDRDDPLVGPAGPLGLDSLDALEIVTAVQRKYAIRIDDRNTSLQVLQSLRTLADFVRTQQPAS